MRFQHVVVVGLGWLLAVVVGCTSGESKRISGISNFVPTFAFDSIAFDSKVENSKAENAEVEDSEVVEPSEITEQSESPGLSLGNFSDRTRTSLQEILPKLPWKRKPSEPSPNLHGPDVLAPLTEKEKAELGVAEWPRAASLKPRFRVGKPRISKITQFRTRSIQGDGLEVDEFRSIDAELEGMYATNSDAATRGLDALLADADAMSELDSFATDSASAEMIVLRATPAASAFQPSAPKAQTSLGLIQHRDRSFKVSDDVSIRSLPFVSGDQTPPAVEPAKGLPASSLSWRERLQKYPVTQDQTSNSVATLIQPEQTELRVLRMTAVTPEDRSVRVAPQASIRSIGSPTFVRGEHPDVLQSPRSPSIELTDPLPTNRRVYSSGKFSEEKTFNR